ncbi:MAG: adenylate kinase [Candidatus Ranarchaeia archaeon]
MKVVLTGVPGCGKTTISSRIKEHGHIHVINFGTIMFEVAQEKFGLHDRDDMRRELTPEKYKMLQLEAGRRIGEMQGDVLIDTHASIKTKYGYLPGLPREVLELISPDVIALIELNPATIIKRRKKDMQSGTRVGRDREAEREIDLHQTMNRHFVTAYATLASCFIAYIRHTWEESYPYEHSDLAVKALLDIFKGAK